MTEEQRTYLSTLNKLIVEGKELTADQAMLRKHLEYLQIKTISVPPAPGNYFLT